MSYSAPSFEPAPLDDEFQCPICFHDMHPAMSFPCMHKICGGCASVIDRQPVAAQACPLCSVLGAVIYDPIYTAVIEKQQQKRGYVCSDCGGKVPTRADIRVHVCPPSGATVGVGGATGGGASVAAAAGGGAATTTTTTTTNAVSNGGGSGGGGGGSATTTIQVPPPTVFPPNPLVDSTVGRFAALARDAGIDANTLREIVASVVAARGVPDDSEIIEKILAPSAPTPTPQRTSSSTHKNQNKNHNKNNKNPTTNTTTAATTTTTPTVTATVAPMMSITLPAPMIPFATGTTTPTTTTQSPLASNGTTQIITPNSTITTALTAPTSTTAPIASIAPVTAIPPTTTQAVTQHGDGATMYIDFDQFANESVDFVSRLFKAAMRRLVERGFVPFTAKISAIAFGLSHSFGNPNMQHQLNVMNIQMRVVSSRKKEETDRQIERDAMEGRLGYDTIVLVSSDQDFTWCASRLVSKGKTVIVVHNARPGSTHESNLSLYPTEAWHHDELFRPLQQPQQQQPPQRPPQQQQLTTQQPQQVLWTIQQPPPPQAAVAQRTTATSSFPSSSGPTATLSTAPPRPQHQHNNHHNHHNHHHHHNNNNQHQNHQPQPDKKTTTTTTIATSTDVFRSNHWLA